MGRTLLANYITLSIFVTAFLLGHSLYDGLPTTQVTFVVIEVEGVIPKLSWDFYN